MAAMAAFSRDPCHLLHQGHLLGPLQWVGHTIRSMVDRRIDQDAALEDHRLVGTVGPDLLLPTGVLTAWAAAVKTTTGVGLPTTTTGASWRCARCPELSTPLPS